MLTKDDEIPGANMTNGHIYTLMSNGSVVGPLTCEGVSFPVSQGKAVRYMMDGTTLDKMYNLTEVKLTAATTNGTAVAVNGQKFDQHRCADLPQAEPERGGYAVLCHQSG